MSNAVTIPFQEGEQYWVLLASDKWGLSEADIITDKLYGLGVALDAILSQAKGQPFIEGPWQKFGTGNDTFRIGNARPVQVVSVTKAPPARPSGKVLADRNSYAGDGIPTVDGQSPWYIAIRIWWRAPTEQLPWPAFTSRLPALPNLENTIQADWVLDCAIDPAVKAKDPGDASWTSTQADQIAKTAATVGTGLLNGAAVIAAAAIAVAILVATVKQKAR